MQEKRFSEWLREENYREDDIARQIASLHSLNRQFGDLDQQIATATVGGVDAQLVEAAARTGEEGQAAGLLRRTLNRYRRFMLEKRTGMTDDELLAHFVEYRTKSTNRPDFHDTVDRITAEQKRILCDLMRTVHDEGMDWYSTGTSKDYFRFGRKESGSGITFGYIKNENKKLWLSFRKEFYKKLNIKEDHSFPINNDTINIYKKFMDGNRDFIDDCLNVKRIGRWPDEYQNKDSLPIPLHESMSEKKDTMTDTPVRKDAVNLILYGPPGTGKTYATAAEAIALCGESVPEGREALMEVYHRLMHVGRIEFVTFHQSVAYEDFVEGLRPQQEAMPCGPEGQPAAGFSLVAKDGIFRRIVRAALGENREGEEPFALNGRRVFKISMGVADDRDDAHVFEDAIRNGYAIIGYVAADLSDPRFTSPVAILQAVQDAGVAQDKKLTLSSGWVRMPNTFRNQIRIGDILVVSRGNSRFRAVGVVTGDYYFEPLAQKPQYAHRRQVKWLWEDPVGQSVSKIYAKDFSMATVYQMTPELINIPALGQYVEERDETLPAPEPYVLIIDEINRANISKVFGELITLLEPDKRLGELNEIQVRLPYSGDMFGVPPNLHIIGTMNTADRSIALLDTALRRRFDFRELMPDPDTLKPVDGIDLAAVLRTLNERIEYLFDREHQIGHAYFIGCRKRDDIDQVMRDRIIPLLAEYFYEDWDKVAAVLGDADEKEGDNTGGFLIREKLPVPRGLGLENDGTARYRWRVRTDGFDYFRGLLGA